MKKRKTDKMDSGSKRDRVVVNTPYDDAYRTLQNDCRKWLIPMVNEIFDEHYTGEEPILPLANEHFLNMQDGAEQERVTDSSFTILGEIPKKYHMECQSRPDGSMLIRMFEYDSQIALDDAQLSEYEMTVTFPRSAVLFLRHNRRTPDEMKICIRTIAGEVSYPIPVVKLQSYSLREIFEKNLLLLIPFYIFCYEKEFGRVEEEAEKMEQLREDYREIRENLDRMCEKGRLTEYEKRIMIEMSKKVLDSIAAGHPKVREGVSDAMGGKVLDCEAKVILRQGIAQGLEQGITQGFALSILDLLQELGDVPAELCDKINAEKSGDTLRKWIRAAARAESVQAFRDAAGL